MLQLFLAVAFAADAPEISRSAGEKGGTVVLWPRVVPRTEDPGIAAVAAEVQARLKALAAAGGPLRPLDLRPEPERVCPQSGCKGLAVGAVLHHSEGGCVLVVTLQPPGRSPQTLLPWAGLVDLKETTVPFREPPESMLTVKDFATCDGLVAGATLAEPAIITAITAASEI